VVLSDYVPVWILAGAVATGGWFYEQVQDREEFVDLQLSAKGERIAILENENKHIRDKLDDIKNTVNRIESYILSKED
jgi:hypothetical protein